MHGLDVRSVVIGARGGVTQGACLQPELEFGVVR